MEILLSIAVALLAGLMMTRLIKPLGLPAVTGYLIAGILIGPFCLGHFGIDGLGITEASLEHFGLISNVALGFIAFSIGNEFRVSQLRQIGKKATVIAIIQALTATIFVDAALIGLHFFVLKDTLPLGVAITLGAVATATAPAATLMVIRQYKAKGKVTDILLPVVALDDAVGLVVFAVSVGIAKGMVNAGTALSAKELLVGILVNPLIEIVASLVLGAVVGFVFSEVEKLFHSRSKRLAVSVMFVILTVGLTMIKDAWGPVDLGFSPLLACMMLGTVFCNMCESSEELMDRVDRWTTPLFALFFVISGAELNLAAFSDWAIVVIGVVYIIFRSLGKYFGAFGSAKLMKCEDTIVKYLGITLLPQAGVALGMAAIAMQDLPEGQGEIVRDVVLFSVLIYELVGPMLTKIALTKAGEIIPHERKSSKVINADRQK